MADESKTSAIDPTRSCNERVQELTWALLDEQISDDEMSLLDNLLLSDDAARRRYIDCVQLHTDLMQHFRQADRAGRAADRQIARCLAF